jgi:osmotically inducible protein OsmC
MATRNGSAEWHGDLQSGNGQVTVGNGAHTGPYSFKSRFEDGEGTNPEELIAAAEAACFSMALSLILTEAGSPPESIRTSARAQLRPVDGAPTITQMAIQTEGVVPGIDQAAFEQHAQQAKETCVISRALGGIEEFTLEATLKS